MQIRGWCVYWSWPRPWRALVARPFPAGSVRVGWVGPVSFMSPYTPGYDQTLEDYYNDPESFEAVP